MRSSKITLEQAEYEFLSFVRQHTPPGQCPLAGESQQKSDHDDDDDAPGLI